MESEPRATKPCKFIWDLGRMSQNRMTSHGIWAQGPKPPTWPKVALPDFPHALSFATCRHEQKTIWIFFCIRRGPYLDGRGAHDLPRGHLSTYMHCGCACPIPREKLTRCAKTFRCAMPLILTTCHHLRKIVANCVNQELWER